MNEQSFDTNRPKIKQNIVNRSIWMGLFKLTLEIFPLWFSHKCLKKNQARRRTKKHFSGLQLNYTNINFITSRKSNSNNCTNWKSLGLCKSEELFQLLALALDLDRTDSNEALNSTEPISSPANGFSEIGWLNFVYLAHPCTHTHTYAHTHTHKYELVLASERWYLFRCSYRVHVTSSHSRLHREMKSSIRTMWNVADTQLYTI